MRSSLSPSLSGLSTLNEDQIAERGARMARREAREYREYLSAEQRSQPGCPAREVVLDQRGPATSVARMTLHYIGAIQMHYHGGHGGRTEDTGLLKKESRDLRLSTVTTVVEHFVSCTKAWDASH